MILILAIIGFCIACYAYYVERKMKTDATYRPACDINDRISCSKAIQSPYAKLFILSNSILAMIYYTVVGLLAFMGLHTLLIAATVFGVVTSCFFAYLLYFKIKTLCLVCTSLYIINIALLIASLL